MAKKVVTVSAKVIKPGDVKIDTARTSFPDHMADFSAKLSKTWGLSVGKAITHEWFSKLSGAGNCSFYTTRAEIERRRAYAQGTQSTAMYRDAMKKNGDLSYTNLDFRPVPIIPKFVDIVANGINQKEYSINAYSIDPISVDERQTKRERLKKEMVLKPLNEQFQQQTGMNMSTMQGQDIPESEQEIDLLMDINYKPGIELSEQLAIRSILDDNKFDTKTKGRLIRDLVVLGLAASKHRFIKSEGVKAEYVDPADMVYSYTKDPYFTDCYYFGEFKKTLITEVFRDYPSLTIEEKERIQSIGNAWDYHFNISATRDIPNNDNLKGTVGLLYFNYKTIREKSWKVKETKTGGKKAIEKEGGFKAKKEGLFDSLTKTEEVWFEGVLIAGTDILLEWKLSENMVRPKSNFNKVKPNYSLCAPLLEETGHVDSIVNRMIPFADEIQIINLKIQTVIRGMIPDGHEINIEGIANVSLGNGAKYDHNEAINMFLQTGNILTRGSSVSGEFNHSKKIVQENSTSGFQGKLAALTSQYQFKLQMIRDVTGINEARDGSAVMDKDSVVGLQKMAAYNSNIATKHVQNGFLYIITDLAESLSYRIADVLEYSPTRDDLVNKIGSRSVKRLEEIKDLHLRDFSIGIEYSLDDEEKAKKEQDLTYEIQKGTITTEDKYAIMNIKDHTLSYRYLSLLRKKNAKAAQQAEMQKIQANEQSQVNIANAAAQAKLQVVQTEGQLELQKQQLINQGKIEALNTEAQLKERLMHIEFELQMQIKSKEGELKGMMTAYGEDRKDFRTQLANQQMAASQGDGTDQVNPEDALKFESNMDHMNAFRL